MHGRVLQEGEGLLVGEGAPKSLADPAYLSLEPDASRHGHVRYPRMCYRHGMPELALAVMPQRQMTKLSAKAGPKEETRQMSLHTALDDGIGDGRYIR